MKKWLRSLSGRQIKLGLSAGISAIIFLILTGVIALLAGMQAEQNVSRRWSSEGGVAQVSCFFSPNAGITQDSIESFEHSLDNALKEASIEQDSPNPGARLWADAYSADGAITLSTDKGTVQADALGIGGDFFLFHQLQLLNGSYFSGNDLMQDYVILDRDSAWQLFGSVDVAGMPVNIAGRPHMVIGVVECPTGRLYEAAGLDGIRVFVSYETLRTYGQSSGINHFEIVMPNPVKQYALNYVREQLGSQEREVEVLENNTRYSIGKRLRLLLGFGTRSMNGKAIIYPYWENVARGYEDILTLLTLFQMLFLIYPSVVLLVWIIIRWKNKTWTARTVLLAVQDKLQRAGDRRRERRRSGKNGEKKSWLDDDPKDTIGYKLKKRREQKREQRLHRKIEKEFQAERKEK
ncbi:MAG: ABC transporter permease [Lachnospiraceae bacterium]|nr:ABC transporter permease [Lachnospiraceae bacterium]